jgi:hypothetical protein
MFRARLLFALVLLGLFGPVPPSRLLMADDDPLPNFNAPVDNSPLDADKVNRAMGVTMFKDPSLWDEDDIFVAKRLGWPQESQTMTQSSYRLYPTETKPVKILGARAYSCVLYAEKGRPTEVSIVFVNEGDYEWDQNFLKAAQQMQHHDTSPDATTNPDDTNSAPDTSSDTNAPPTDLTKLNSDDYSTIGDSVHEAFEKALKQDAQTLTDALTGLFGDPAFEGFGGGSETREQVKRWDWQGHAFLLSAPRDQYVTLRIVPVAFADNYGKADTIDRDALKALLLDRVKRADSGDVVVSEIPMVDQGPKGYCVPATWERYLRYLGIPADMYVLAAAAGSSQKGTNLDEMVGNVDSLVTLYHRKIDEIPGDLDMKTIAKNIDMGLPLMWTCSIHIPLEIAITKRKMEREEISDWKAWGAQLQAQDADEIAKEVVGSPSQGAHQRMIIGYNDTTGEIAISDSWSTAFAIRWMTLQEANAINGGELYLIEP